MTSNTQVADAALDAANRLIRPRPFPENFLFGAATAAYQIEGASHTDGRTDSIWDAFARVPGAVINGDNGDVACDHYHRYPQDVEMMAELGLDTYRFSTSWSRVRPDGGPVNQAGIDFYSRLVDELLAKGIKPWLTLYHWDLPQALEEAGGWTNRDTAFRFAEYAGDVHDALGDRVEAWTTLNEPWCSSFLSYVGGEHAPGRQDPAAGVAAGHHLLLAHGLAIQELRLRDPALQLGITLNLTVPDPVDATSPGDIAAARLIDGQFNRFFLDPIFNGAYPDDMHEHLDPYGLASVIRDGDLSTISSPIDALGVNYYHGESLSSKPSLSSEPVRTEAPSPRPKRSPFIGAEGVHWHDRGLPQTDMGWDIQPEGLTRLLLRVSEEYAAPAGVVLYVTENGVAFKDEVQPDGSVDDVDRSNFLRLHLDATLAAIEQGVDVRGYFYWSLMDNYEWAWGYEKRFGLVRVDYETQQRQVKASGVEYARIIAAHSL